MSFCTLTFLVFLALVLTLYSCLKSLRWQNVLITAASLLFYSWWDWRFTGLLLFTSLVDFCAGLGIEAAAERGQERRRKLILAVSLGSNLGVLGFFKYANFFAANLQVLASSLGFHLDWTTLNILLPAGISFYTFQSMSYTIDIYRRELRPTRDLLTFLTFVSFFPQLVAGPIQRARHLLPQFAKLRHFDEAQARDGCRRVLWGLFKKIALADGLALTVERCYGAPEAASGAQIIVATVAFAFQIYCDFSAYSDIAIGSAQLFGVSLRENFHHPYFSQSVAEFWRRWHISLSTWFRDYLYIPLGGSRTPPLRRAMNVMVTFVLSGLWHGASWNFVLWGGLNGLALVPGAFVTRKRGLKPSEVPGGEGWLPSPTAAARMALTFTFICVTWVFFRASTFDAAILMLGKMGSWFTGRGRFQTAQAAVMAIPVDRWVIYGAFLATEWWQRAHLHPLRLQRCPRWARWTLYTGLVWVTLHYAQIAPGQFIYFQF